MRLSSSAFADQAAIPEEYAFCAPDPESHVSLAPNRNPDLAWSGTPEGTASLVIICVDGDVPTKPDDVNQEGREVPADLPRTDFYHWVLVGVPPGVTGIEAGSFSDSVVARGKGEQAPFGRVGRNDYTAWFSGDPDMEGTYLGYDGPCPPWNDSIVHHYAFHVYALDLAQLPVSGDFGGAEVMAAMAGHVLDEASITGTYTLNPRLR